MKLAWSMLNGTDDFSMLMRSKYKGRNGRFIHYHKPSSIWAGIKEALFEVTARSQWIIGNGNNIDIWRDNWLGDFSLQQLMQLRDQDIAGHNSKLSSMVTENVITIPRSLSRILEYLGVNPRSPIICSPQDKDYRIWCPDVKGKFSTKSAFESIERTSTKVSWYKNILNNFIHPKTTATGWKLLHGCAATDDRKVGYSTSFCLQVM
ncbi:hypothetical protein IFM89_026709 [Coptis chinensis]|uniref:Uncharacterized protein n=1 Tax=Coptis chinensis TaxID=261450 RepID=A0A835MDK9_9MAGN|nr:hypothetical protein IFM89_026709 [Coptis chinensis]